MLLAIETSCDETAVALFSTENALLGKFPSSSDLLGDLLFSQVAVHREYGGVVPEIAAREHVKRLPLLIEELLATTKTSYRDITAVAVTVGPGLKGCLIVGLSWAKGFCLANKLPLIPVNHIEGHLLSAEISMNQPYSYPTLGLIVSGGHTELILIEGFRKYQVVARTRDDAAGEAFDKTATLLGLGYPGGPALSKQAALGNPDSYSFSVSAKNEPSVFSFSGLKTAAHRAINSAKSADSTLTPEKISDLAASIEKGIVDNLIDKALQACHSFKPHQLIIAGGVAANKTLRDRMAQALSPLGVAVFAPPFSLCTDNAVMIGHTALRTIQSNPSAFINWDKTNPSKLGPDAPFEIGVLARFPIENITH